MSLESSESPPTRKIPQKLDTSLLSSILLLLGQSIGKRANTPRIVSNSLIEVVLHIGNQLAKGKSNHTAAKTMILAEGQRLPVSKCLIPQLIPIYPERSCLFFRQKKRQDLVNGLRLPFDKTSQCVAHNTKPPGSATWQPVLLLL